VRHQPKVTLQLDTVTGEAYSRSMSVRKSRIVVVAACLCALLAAPKASVAQSVPAGSGSRNVQITMVGGRVSIIANQAPLADIMKEWARVGGTTIVNAEKISGVPLTFELTDKTEREALDILMRPVSGYMGVMRSIPDDGVALAVPPGISQYARIIILPKAAAAQPTAAASGRQSVPAMLPTPATTFAASEPVFATPSPGVTRIIGANGEPVADDQDGRPSPQRPAPFGYSSGDEPPPYQRAISPQRPSVVDGGPAPRTPAVVGTSVPGMVVPVPTSPTGAPQQQR
jgi:hypothetical protein